MAKVTKRKCSVCGRAGHDRRRHVNPLEGFVKDGKFHPIRKSEGYDASRAGDGHTVHPYFVDKAKRLIAAGAYRGTDQKQLARHLETVRDVEKEHGKTSSWLDAAKLWGKTRQEIQQAAKDKIIADRKRAGVKALVKKYGAAGASRIVYKHSGKTIRETPRGQVNTKRA